MARIRTIKPEFWADEKLAPCTPVTRLVFLGLIGMADDLGRVLDNLKQIDAFIFPETSDTSRDCLAELASRGRIQRGHTASGQRVIQIVNWHHQRIERPNVGGALPPIDGDLSDEHTRYVARKRLSKYVRDEIWQRDRSTCRECGRENLRREKKDKYDAGKDLGEIDHATEAIDGGEPTLENLRLLCLPCNRRKAGERRRARNIARSQNDRARLADTSATNQRTISDTSALDRSPDLRPTTSTSDLRPLAKRAKKPRVVAPVENWVSEFGDWWITDIGTVDYGQLGKLAKSHVKTRGIERIKRAALRYFDPKHGKVGYRSAADFFATIAQWDSDAPTLTLAPNQPEAPSDRLRRMGAL